MQCEPQGGHGLGPVRPRRASGGCAGKAGARTRRCRHASFSPTEAPGPASRRGLTGPSGLPGGRAQDAVEEVDRLGEVLRSLARELHAVAALAEALDRLRPGDDLALAGHGGQVFDWPARGEGPAGAAESLEAGRADLISGRAEAAG